MKVIEFLGMPRAGKTEQIGRLCKYLESKGLSSKVIADREIEKEINCSPAQAFEYNILFFKKILEKTVLAEKSNKYAVLILDRGFFDAQAWFDMEYERRKITKQELKEAFLFLEPLQKKYADLAIMMIINPETTFERYEKKGERSLTDDYVMTREYIQQLYEAYLRLKKKLAKKISMLIIDGTLSAEKIEQGIKKKIESII